jgi:hypothetical protein
MAGLVPSTGNASLDRFLQGLDSVRFGDLPCQIAANGYQVLPNGLIVQWGLTTPVDSETTVTVTFPVKFPNACFVCIPGTYNGSAVCERVFQVNTYNQTGATFQLNAWGTSTGTQLAHWVAIGY